jgi:hypothetical protein
VLEASLGVPVSLKKMSPKTFSEYHQQGLWHRGDLVLPFLGLLISLTAGPVQQFNGVVSIYHKYYLTHVSLQNTAYYFELDYFDGS